MRPLSSLAILIVTLPMSVLAATPRTFNELAGKIVEILNMGAGVLVVAAIVIYFYGTSTSLFNTESGESREKLKSYLGWGLLVLFVMVSIWGILRVLQATLFAQDASSNTPSDYNANRGNDFVVPTYAE